MQPIYEFGGTGAVMHLAVANGFPPQTYAPLLQPFSADYRVVCLPPRALWPGEQPPATLQNWHIVADDLLTGMETYNLRDVIAVGHSFGGIASILAALQQPERFRALILLDPTILPTFAMEMMAQMQAEGRVGEFPLVQGALRRGRQWANVDEAYQYFRGKTLFHDWSDEAVMLYTTSATQPNADGVELVWPAEWEAYYFSTLYTRTWEIVGQLQLPLLVIRGGSSDTFVPEALEKLRGILPDATYAEVEGHGHMFPQSAPDATRAIISDWLANLA